MSIHYANYDQLINKGEIVLPFIQFKVLIRKLDLEGYDFHYEKQNNGLYLIEVH